MTTDRARSFGEVFTPEWMVEEMLSPIRAQLNDPNGFVLDLCCGQGVFIGNILHHRLQQTTCDADILVALGTLVGVELLQENVATTRKHLLDVVSQHVRNPDMLEKATSIVERNVIQWDVLSNGESEAQICDLASQEMKKLTEIHWTAVVSNPPYQKNISGGTNVRNRSKSTPIYQHFYQYAKSLNPTYISFIIPAKWYAGGWNLDDFRKNMLTDSHISVLSDYRTSGVVFPKVEVNGGVCWFIRDRSFSGVPRVIRHDETGEVQFDGHRPLRLDGIGFFVRDERAVSILRKVRQVSEKEHAESFSEMILPTTPFGLNSNFQHFVETADKAHDIQLFYIKRKIFWVQGGDIQKNQQYVDSWKIFLPLCFNQYSAQKIGQPAIFGKKSVCTHSYIAVVGFQSQQEAENCVSYMRSRFFRFLVGLLKISPIATRKVYQLIPQQSWVKSWSDKELFQKYGLDDTEVAYIQDTISAM